MELVESTVDAAADDVDIDSVTVASVSQQASIQRPLPRLSQRRMAAAPPRRYAAQRHIATRLLHHCLPASHNSCMLKLLIIMIIILCCARTLNCATVTPLPNSHSPQQYVKCFPAVISLYFTERSQCYCFLQLLFLTTREAAWYIILVVSVCQTITFESLDVGSSYLHIWYISTEYRSSSYMKVIRSRSRSQEQKR